MMRRSTMVMTRGRRRAALLTFAAGTAAVGLPTAIGSECPSLEYSAVDGANQTEYQGDLAAGVLTFTSVVESEFSVERTGDPGGEQIGLYSDNGAQYIATLYLVDFIYSGHVDGYGDVAVFEGGGSGTDFLTVDENGRSIEGEFVTFVLVDRRDLPEPKILGTGAVRNVTHSHDTFQSVALNFLRNTGSIQTEAEGHPSISLEQYLAMGGFPIRLEFAGLSLSGDLLPADLDDDGVVGLGDLGLMLAAYGACIGDDGYLPDADLNHNGCIDLPDLGELLSVYDQGCY
jgi:hypothetical protein